MNDIREISPDGKLRLRALKNGKGVVELDCNGKWVWCIYRSQPMERAHETFEAQRKFHLAS